MLEAILGSLLGTVLSVICCLLTLLSVASISITLCTSKGKSKGKASVEEEISTSKISFSAFANPYKKRRDKQSSREKGNKKSDKGRSRNQSTPLRAQQRRLKTLGTSASDKLTESSDNPTFTKVLSDLESTQIQTELSGKEVEAKPSMGNAERKARRRAAKEGSRSRESDETTQEESTRHAHSKQRRKAKQVNGVSDSGTTESVVTQDTADSVRETHKFPAPGSAAGASGRRHNRGRGSAGAPTPRSVPVPSPGPSRAPGSMPRGRTPLPQLAGSTKPRPPFPPSAGRGRGTPVPVAQSTPYSRTGFRFPGPTGPRGPLVRAGLRPPALPYAARAAVRGPRPGLPEATTPSAAQLGTPSTRARRRRDNKYLDSERTASSSSSQTTQGDDSCISTRSLDITQEENEHLRLSMERLKKTPGPAGPYRLPWIIAEGQLVSAKVKAACDDFVRRALITGVAGFRKEFAEMRTYRPSGYSVVAFSANTAKNRYTDVPCLDSTRVILKYGVPPKSDYIHANYVKMENMEQLFIATQAPKEETIEDFWRMVYQEEARTVMMLCNVVENGRQRCEQYWPLGVHSKEKMGDFIVCTRRVVRDGAMEAYDLSVSGGAHSVVLTLKLYHLTNWPDKGVPESGFDILRLIHYIDNSAPCVVHCSAGIGRTGTTIATAVITERLFKGIPVKLVSVLKELRNKRASSVQTEAQYVFIISAVLDYLNVKVPGVYEGEVAQFRAQVATAGLK